MLTNSYYEAVYMPTIQYLLYKQKKKSYDWKRKLVRSILFSILDQYEIIAIVSFPEK